MSGFAVGDVLDNPAGSRNLYPITLKSYDPNTRTWDFAWVDGYPGRVSVAGLSALVKIGSTEPAALQVGDVVEIVTRDLRNMLDTFYPAATWWKVHRVYTDGSGYAIRSDRGDTTSAGPGEIRKIASPAPVAQSCNCSARDLWVTGHTCGLANSDPWRALAGVFE